MSRGDAASLRWTVVVPLRGLPSAKSRLAVALTPQVHAQLVAAIQADTVAAARSADGVARVLIVGDGDRDGVDLVQHSAGLNGALRDGAAHAGEQWPDDGIAALVGDLPALRADQLSAALSAAAAFPAAFVPDAAGTGTTLVTATPGTALDPRYGSGSAARHAEIAARLAAGESLRCDVDTLDDLAAAARLGLGARTADVIAAEGLLTRSS